MSASVGVFDPRVQRAWSDAKDAHPCIDVLKGLTAESMAETLRPVWRMKARDYGNGHKEVCVWEHVPNPHLDLERAVERDLAHLKPPRGEGDREENQRRAARRARQRIRENCKALGVSSLWTLTFRENVTDREVALRCLDRFRRKVEKALPGWRYVAVLEPQERGAWHIHLATHALPWQLDARGVKLKSWDVMRGIWRGVTRELGGNFDEAKRKGRWGGRKPFKGAGRIAGYIAKYIGKDVDDAELNRKRYSSSKGIEVPDAYRAQWAEQVSQVELIELAFAALGQNVTRVFFDPVSRVFFGESDDSG